MAVGIHKCICLLLIHTYLSGHITGGKHDYLDYSVWCKVMNVFSNSDQMCYISDFSSLCKLMSDSDTIVDV